MSGGRRVGATLALLVVAGTGTAACAPLAPHVPLRGADASGAVVVEPGSPLLRDAPPPGERRERFLLLVRRDGRDSAQSLLARETTIDARGRLLVVQRYRLGGGTSVDSATADARTLLPRDYAAAHPSGGRERFTFAGARVAGGVTTPSGTTKPIERTFAGPVFNAVLEDELLRRLPLARGRTIAATLYNPGRATLSQRYRVVRAARVAFGGTTVDAWEVALDGSPVPTTLWVARRGGAVLQLRVRLPDGAEFWKLRLPDAA